ncbi:MAG: metal ABC transporter permease [Candidatus Rokubacteria bacterium]|nr:metal ABC transporter permease [Candidatus Rokubacteria bacterium]
MLEALQHSFFQHALAAGTLVAAMCSFLGVYVVLRRIVFLSIALAQIASAGVALGFLVHVPPLFTALAASLAGAAGLARTAQRRRVPTEAVLGIAYVLAAALAVIFVAKNPLGEARALNMFFGNILSVPTAELLALAVVVPLIGLVHLLFAKEFLFVSFDFETARAHGVNARLWDLVLLLTLALAVALAIKTTGVLVTFALLVVPATTARLLVNRIAPMFGLAVGFGVATVPIGLTLALRFNLPTGSAIAATSACLLIVVALARQLTAAGLRAATAAGVAAALLLAFPAPGGAQRPGGDALEQEVLELKQALRELRETVKAQHALILRQQEQIEALAARQRVEPAPATPPGTRPGAASPAAQPAPAPLAKDPSPPQPGRPGIPPWIALLPEVRIEGNFIYNHTFRNRKRLEAELGEERADEEFFARRNRFNFREVELGLRSAVDPFATFEGIISAQQTFGGDVEVELEEGILTLTRLPFRLGAKLGKFRTGFGEFNDSDPEEFPEVDPPNVITNLFGKEGDGWIDTGIRAELPFALGEVPFLLSAGIFNGDNEEAFHGGRAGFFARKPAYFGRLEAFFELGPAAAIELGAGFAYGHTRDEAGRPTLRSRIFNAHFEFDYRHPVFGLYRGFNFLTELYYTWRDRFIEAELDDQEVIVGREVLDRYGLYALGELQLTRNWFVAGRFDYSQLPEREEIGPSRRIETAGSAILSYKPSRFLTLRAQYKHSERNFAPTSDELFLQALFLLGYERPGPF